MNKILIDNYPLIVSYCINNYSRYEYKYDSIEDMISILTIEVLDKLKYYNKDISKISTYIYMILDNKVNDYTKFKNKYNNNVILESIVDDYNFIDSLYEVDTLDEILPLLEDITKDYYLYGKLLKEIAEEKQVTIQAISSRIQRNIDRIKNKLK